MIRLLIFLLTLSCFAAPTFAGTCRDLLASKKTSLLSFLGHIDRFAPKAWLPPVPQDEWQVSYLDPHYTGEELAKSAYHSQLPDVLRNQPIHYYSSEELSEAQVVFRSGKVFRPNGDLLQKIYGMEYVMSPDGQILIMPHYIDIGRGDHRLKHSSLSNGGPVAASGHISFDEYGEVMKIDRFSGHYKPSRLQLKQFIDQLKSLGVDLSGTEIIWN